MGRVAALLILASQILLLWVVFDPTGLPSIWFSFAGHPLVAVGVALGLWVVTRRLMGAAHERNAVDPEEY
jgi:H+/gluconate symporter-like permease